MDNSSPSEYRAYTAPPPPTADEEFNEAVPAPFRALIWCGVWLAVVLLVFLTVLAGKSVMWLIG